jgi:hypothetical protein
MTQFSLIDRVRARVRSQVGKPFERRVRAPLRRIRNAGRQYRPIFVAGAAGSGTSLLAVSVAQRLECAGLVYELDSQISRKSFLSVPDPDSFGSVAEYESFIAPSEEWSVEAGRSDLLDLFRSYGSGKGSAIVAKGPDINLVRAEFLAQCFPNARFLLVCRDPVANVEGWRRKWSLFGNDSLEECIRFYAEMHETFLRFAKRGEERFAGVSYEEFVENPDEKLSAIAARFQLERARRRRRLARVPNVAGMGIRNVRNGEIGVVTDANQCAYERLGPEQAEAISSALGELHSRLHTVPFKV